MPGLLSFHAHPDDESISTGGLLASTAHAGIPVVVVTATRGEEGEIHNRVDADAIRDELGEVRARELAKALEVLGAGAPLFLGYRDSGMMGTAANGDPECFWQAEMMEAVGRLVALIRRHRPDVVTAYDPFGGYGHPDHIQVHRVGTAAYWAAHDVGRFPADTHGDPWAPAKLYWATWSRERMVQASRRMSPGGAAGNGREPGSGSVDRNITTTIDVSGWVEHKHRALLCHDTQFPADSWVRALPDEALRDVLGHESLTLVHSAVRCDPADPDIFAGI